MNIKSCLTKALPFVLLAAAPGLVLFGAGIRSTSHDFSGRSWNSSREVCVVCHTPHSAKPSASLLWNRDMTSAVFTLYQSPTINHTPGQPDGASKLCLSCHDGTIAIDRFGSRTGGTAYVGWTNLRTDLTDDHPVSFVYDSAMAAAAKTLKDPAVANSGLGGTISQDMLRDGKLQCVSCHNPHDNTNYFFLRKSNAGSALCLTCHNL
ncbi:MAG: cytochrome c3 family protein [Elusimicrobia bacterium]|nr:cytochrome c3 family protein [Elusimicrobiota bacterium]